MSTMLTDAHRTKMLEKSGLLSHRVETRLAIIAETTGTFLKADLCEINGVSATEQIHAVQWPVPPPTPTLPDRYPAGGAGCRIVIERDAILAIDDTHNSEVCSGMPWIEFFRSYLGAPVHFDGAAIGTVCILTFEPRRWTMMDQIKIQGFADAVGNSLLEA